MEPGKRKITHMFDFACVGNALIDSFLDISEANNLIRIDKDTNELRLRLGEKIIIDSAKFELGGNACNVSVGLAKLGLKTSLIAEIGDDAFSNRIKKSLQSENVDLSRFTISHAPASFATGISYKNDRILFVHHVERQHNFNFHNLQSKWIYLSSIGEKWRHVYREIQTLVKKEKLLLAFNPGTKQIAAGREVLESVLAVTEVLFLNKEEAESVLNSKERISNSHSEQIKNLCFKLQKAGAKIVVITDGDKGSYVLDINGNFFQQKIFDAEVVEKTGAGDGFASGFLAAVQYGYDLQTALIWGTLNSASVIGKVGAQKGLLTKEQLMNKL